MVDFISPAETVMSGNITTSASIREAALPTLIGEAKGETLSAIRLSISAPLRISVSR